MKRPRAHEVGDIAENIVAGAFLDHGWIVNRMTSDYGYDLLVSQLPTAKGPHSFSLVQIKGTDRQLDLNSEGNFSFRLATDHVKYWSETPIPVYICIVNVSTKAIWAFSKEDVVRALDNRVGEKWKNSVRATIRVNNRSLLTSERAEEIRNDVLNAWDQLRELSLTAAKAASLGAILYVSWLYGVQALQKFKYIQSKLSEILGNKGDEILFQGLVGDQAEHSSETSDQ